MLSRSFLKVFLLTETASAKSQQYHSILIRTSLRVSTGPPMNRFITTRGQEVFKQICLSSSIQLKTWINGKFNKYVFGRWVLFSWAILLELVFVSWLYDRKGQFFEMNILKQHWEICSWSNQSLIRLFERTLVKIEATSSALQSDPRLFQAYFGLIRGGFERTLGGFERTLVIRGWLSIAQ